MNKREFAARIIMLLENDPTGWTFDTHHAMYAGVSIWINNGPWLDLTVDDIKIGSFWQRRKIRKLIKRLKLSAIGQNLLVHVLGSGASFPGQRYKP